MKIEVVAENLKRKDDLRGFLYKRWVNHMGGGYHSRVLWDLVPVNALLHPEWVSEVKSQTPPENI